MYGLNLRYPRSRPCYQKQVEKIADKPKYLHKLSPLDLQDVRSLSPKVEEVLRIKIIASDSFPLERQLRIIQANGHVITILVTGTWKKKERGTC